MVGGRGWGGGCNALREGRLPVLEDDIVLVDHSAFSNMGPQVGEITSTTADRVGKTHTHTRANNIPQGQNVQKRN